MIKIRDEISKMISSPQKIETINKTKSWYFEKINKMDKPLAKLTKKKREHK